MSVKSPITVLGSGISGLTTALLLLREGYQVNIISNEVYTETVSAKAAAIWLPFKAEPIEAVNRWSKRSFEEYVELIKIGVDGVSLVPFTIIEKTTDKPYWFDALPEEFTVLYKPAKFDHSTGFAYDLKVPLIESQIYLPYLQNEILALGGVFEYRHLKKEELPTDTKLTINCTGLGSAALFDDRELYPIQGQIVKMPPVPGIKGLSQDYPMDQFKDELVYIIPRRDCTILGGSAKSHTSVITPDPELTKRIIKRCATFAPELEQLEPLTTIVGLRPGRPFIRLEKDPFLPVIHNYGHGGAGFTVSWGCAYDVLHLVNHHFIRQN